MPLQMLLAGTHPKRLIKFSASLVSLLCMKTRSGQRVGPVHAKPSTGHKRKRNHTPQPVRENFSPLAPREQNAVPSEGCMGDPAASNAAWPSSQRDTSAVTGTAQSDPTAVPVDDVLSGVQRAFSEDEKF